MEEKASCLLTWLNVVVLEKQIIRERKNTPPTLLPRLHPVVTSKPSTAIGPIGSLNKNATISARD